MYIISACLLGCNCKYNGGNNRNEKVIQFTKENKYIIICPETEGGLSSPRPPAEQKPEENEIRVIDKEGRDLTEAFILGAQRSIVRAEKAAAAENDVIEGAVLKANSPSCGSGMIYDGSFSGKLKEGDGIFAGLLKERGIPVFTEKDFLD